MTTTVKNVFMILGVMLISLLLYRLTFGTEGRLIMWSGVKPSIERTWRTYTLEDGKLIDNALQRDFDTVVDLSSR